MTFTSTGTDPTSLLRRHTLRLTEALQQVERHPTVGPAPTAVAACVRSGGGITEELLGALVAHNQALDTMESVVDPIRGRTADPGDAVTEAMESAYQASDVAHDAVRQALRWLQDAVRFQRDAVRVAHLAAMIAAGTAPTVASRGCAR
ncbi:MAG: hypothetical protein M3137_20760 [Actinomycetota bacterium]|nr:hypothetical protein [Actinomycetota bacterium]